MCRTASCRDVGSKKGDEESKNQEQTVNQR